MLRHRRLGVLLCSRFWCHGLHPTLCATYAAELHSGSRNRKRGRAEFCGAVHEQQHHGGEPYRIGEDPSAETRHSRSCAPPVLTMASSEQARALHCCLPVAMVCVAVAVSSSAARPSSACGWPSCPSPTVAPRQITRPGAAWVVGPV
eukprot:SAG31_NODE_12244_length_956_cov_1.122520_1_plen_147_part_00